MILKRTRIGILRGERLKEELLRLKMKVEERREKGKRREEIK